MIYLPCATSNLHIDNSVFGWWWWGVASDFRDTTEQIVLNSNWSISLLLWQHYGISVSVWWVRICDLWFCGWNKNSRLSPILVQTPFPKSKSLFILRSTDALSSIIWSIGNPIIVPRQCKPWYCKHTWSYSVYTVRWCCLGGGGVYMDLPCCRHKSIPGLWDLHTITLGSRSRCNDTRAWEQQWETAHTSSTPRPKRPPGCREGIQCVKHKQRVKLIPSVKQGTSTTLWVYADWMRSSLLEFSLARWFWTCSTEFVSVGMR